MSFRTLMVWTVVLGVGCSGGADVVVGDLATVDVVEDSQMASDIAVPDLQPDPDLNEPEDTGTKIDFAADDASPDNGYVLCEAGEGCFLDPCFENLDCQSGWCVEHMGDAVCTVLCQEECPPGWTCKGVGSGPDIVSICVSTSANLCKPCSGNPDCTSAGEADDACMDYGAEGSFCGSVCAVDDDCPWGFQCLENETVDGVLLKQCIAEAGVCPCTAKSAALGLWTPCEVANEYGTCAGKRVCMEEGLSDCDALEPMVEVCNGVDDDCDQQVDEPAEVGGDFVNLCNDDNECTEDTCLGEEGCSQVAMDDGECKDGNPCTVADHCVAGVCLGDPVICEDENPCTDNVCTENGGCEYYPNKEDCDDGNPCTVADSCEASECVGVYVPCDCMEDADCAQLEDGDVCNGTLVCDTSEIPHQCVVAEETLVECPGPSGLDGACLQAVCDAQTGECGFEPSGNGMPCTDEDACSIGDVCTDGVCLPGQPANCNDGNACTADACEAEQGCTHGAKEGPCEDGDSCTVGDFCLAGECQSGETMGCDDNNLCTDDSCQPGVGCVFEANAAQCSDGNECTTGDQCVDGACAFTGAMDCDDENPCTTESCEPALGCKYSMLDTPCDDGDDCTIGDTCQSGQCKPGVLMNCNDSNPCTDDSCQEGVGCSHVANSDPCSDNNECTSSDHCLDGDCVFDGTSDCNDGNACTADGCDPNVGCTYEMTEAPCDDDDICTLGDHCHLGDCISAGSLSCNDSNDCTDDSCEPDTGCVFTPNSAPCDLENDCSTLDYCSQGKCQPGEPVDCNDDNPCTSEFCDPVQGCVYFANSNPCEDGNMCTVDDMCANELCMPGEAKNCNDGNVCTDDACLPDSGCDYAFNAAPCEDGDVCTEADSCAQGECVGGNEMDCSDGVFCNGAEICEAGFGCKPGEPPNTNDGVQCTQDFCDEDNDVVVHLVDDGFCNTNMLCKTDTCDPEADCIQVTTPDCCGNSIIEAPEECDEGLANADVPDTCRTNCKLPDCGDGILDAGEECDDGNQVDFDGCQSDCKDQQLVEHFDGFNFFYNTHPKDVHNKQRAIEACENYWGKPCSQKSCGGAQYVIGNHDVNCNNSATQRIWYFGNEGSGYVGGSADYAGWTIHPPNMGGKKAWW